MSRLYTKRQTDSGKKCSILFGQNPQYKHKHAHQAVLVNKPIKAYISVPQRLRQLPIVLPWTCGRCASLQPGASHFSNSHLFQLDEKCWKCLFWPLRAPLCFCRITSRVPLVHRWWWESYFRKEKCIKTVWILIAFRFKLNKKVNNNLRSFLSGKTFPKRFGHFQPKLWRNLTLTSRVYFANRWH